MEKCNKSRMYLKQYNTSNNALPFDKPYHRSLKILSSAANHVFHSPHFREHRGSSHIFTLRPKSININETSYITSCFKDSYLLSIMIATLVLITISTFFCMFVVNINYNNRMNIYHQQINDTDTMNNIAYNNNLNMTVSENFRKSILDLNNIQENYETFIDWQPCFEHKKQNYVKFKYEPCIIKNYTLLFCVDEIGGQTYNDFIKRVESLIPLDIYKHQSLYSKDEIINNFRELMNFHHRPTLRAFSFFEYKNTWSYFYYCDGHCAHFCNPNLNKCQNRGWNSIFEFWIFDYDIKCLTEMVTPKLINPYRPFNLTYFLILIPLVSWIIFVGCFIRTCSDSKIPV